MSEAQVSNEGQGENIPSGENQTSSRGTVSYESHEKLLRQKKAQDEKLKTMESQLNEFLAQKKAEEDAKLMAEKRHEELIQRLKTEKEELAARNAQIQSEIANTLKRTALEREIGGFARPEYAQFADLKVIELNEDGTVDATSVAKEAARLREQHSHLLKPAATPPKSGNPRTAFDPKVDSPKDIPWDQALDEHFKMKEASK